MSISSCKRVAFIQDSYYNEIGITYLLIFMVKVLQATSRGQITLPKKWRSGFNTSCYKVEIKDQELTITPLYEGSTLKSDVEESWEQYKRGQVVSHEDLMKKYGL